jgi:hypothetical protein
MKRHKYIAGTVADAVSLLLSKGVTPSGPVIDTLTKAARSLADTDAALRRQAKQAKKAKKAEKKARKRAALRKFSPPPGSISSANGHNHGLPPLLWPEPGEVPPWHPDSLGFT